MPYRLRPLLELYFATTGVRIGNYNWTLDRTTDIWTTLYLDFALSSGQYTKGLFNGPEFHHYWIILQKDCFANEHPWKIYTPTSGQWYIWIIPRYLLYHGWEYINIGYYWIYWTLTDTCGKLMSRTMAYIVQFHLYYFYLVYQNW